jgi:hypothetical protein
MNFTNTRHVTILRWQNRHYCHLEQDFLSLGVLDNGPLYCITLWHRSQLCACLVKWAARARAVCRLRAGRSLATNSRMLFTKDGAGGQICTLHILKLNLLFILYLKIWNKKVHKSWKSKKLETHNNNVLRFKAFIINKTFSMFGPCEFCILEDLTKNIILIAGHYWPAP